MSLWTFLNFVNFFTNFSLPYKSPYPFFWNPWSIQNSRLGCMYFLVFAIKMYSDFYQQYVMFHFLSYFWQCIFSCTLVCQTFTFPVFMKIIKFFPVHPVCFQPPVSWNFKSAFIYYVLASTFSFFQLISVESCIEKSYLK